VRRWSIGADCASAWATDWPGAVTMTFEKVILGVGICAWKIRVMMGDTDGRHAWIWSWGTF
jgi:hypothetical protein